METTDNRTQTPVAVLGYACRLPGNCNSPRELWEFLTQGSIASNESPDHPCRFTKSSHYDGSGKPGTMPAPGGMFLEEVDLSAFDAFFFNISSTDATSMDPQQRLLLEVAYECLENSGITLEQIRGTNVGCIVANNGVEYEGTAYRDPEEQATAKSTGYSRSILSNRISHFLDINGPSMTIDTACSGTMTALDMACQTLDLHRADGMIVAGATLYYDPITLEDQGPMKEAFSRTGRCHAFDANADGYVRAEAINAVHLKRLDDAIRDGDPIRAVIRGTAVNSDGRTPGITNPNPEAQAAAIRAAYRHAGISSFRQTAFLECHGTGTNSGDPLEVKGIASVFAPSRSADEPLIIGSIKSNIGHSESAAGLSGLIKASMAVERGVIPGNPTFKTPNPSIDFEGSRVRVAQGNVPWPEYTEVRRASVNSFGFGGANGHCVLESTDTFLRDHRGWKTFVSSQGGSGFSPWLHAEDDFDEGSGPLQLLTFSANDRDALAQNVKAISDHLIHPAVNVALSDVAYTLSERRTRHFYKAFIVTDTTEFVAGSETGAKNRATPPRVGFIFTGQGAQWSAMGKDLLHRYPLAREVVSKLEAALQELPKPPSWSLLEELTQKRDTEHLRRPEISQPLTTALQLVQLRLLLDWGVHPTGVVGHSSGEIAAAVAAGLISEEEAIKVAYLRGQAATLEPPQQPLGMLAVGLSEESTIGYIAGSSVHIACYNSPKSLTLSGPVAELQDVCDRIKADGYFARMLQVDLAYHSDYMTDIATRYEELLLETHREDQTSSHFDASGVSMVSSVTGDEMQSRIRPQAAYWRSNMTQPVRFNQALSNLLSKPEKPEFLIEIGPSNALSGPVGQIINDIDGAATQVQYNSAAKRGPDSLRCLLTTVGNLWASGGNLDIAKVNSYERPSLVVDLPNYQWNHSHRYWHQGLASNEWRDRKFISHDLLGSKVLATSWKAPCWTRIIQLDDLPWLRDHEIGGQVLFPAAGFVAMAMEAAYQTTVMNVWSPRGEPAPAKFNYHLENVQFLRGLEILEVEGVRLQVTMTPVYGRLKPWHEFSVMSVGDEGTSTLHCTGLARVSEDSRLPKAPDGAFENLEHTQSGDSIYKKLLLGGYNYGPHFRRLVDIQWVWGEPYTKGTLSMAEPGSKFKQSPYPIHPVSIDSFLQFAGYAVVQKLKKFGFVDNIMVPGRIDALTISSGVAHSPSARVMVSASYSGEGKLDAGPSYSSSGGAWDSENGACIVHIKGMQFSYIERAAGTIGRHPISRLSWKVDPVLTDELSLRRLLSGSSIASGPWLNSIIELVHHRNPGAKVVEVNTDPDSTSCLSLDIESGHEDISPVPYAALVAEMSFISAGPRQLLDVQDRHSTHTNAKFKLLDTTTPDCSISPDPVDFVSLRIGPHTALEAIRSSLNNIIRSLKDGGQVLLVGNLVSENAHQELNDLLQKSFAQCKNLADSSGHFAVLLQTPVRQSNGTKELQEIICVRFSKNESLLSAVDSLRLAGLNIRVHDANSQQPIPASSTVICLDELFESVTVNFTSDHWDRLKALVRDECQLLWVTAGAQLTVTEPDRAASQGLLRVISNEEPHLRIMTLDVEKPSSPSSSASIAALIRELCGSAGPMATKQCEFAEKDGCIYTPRIVADEHVPGANHDSLKGRDVETLDFTTPDRYLQLISEKSGVIDSLEFVEVPTGASELAPDHVEVEIHATGVSHKDLMKTLGHFGGMDDASIGSEGAGVVTRVGSSVTSLKPGQRVAIFWQSMFSNKIRAPAQCVHVIPDALTFEQAATMPVAYLIALRGLKDLGRLEKGQRVLIHSAAGGVGCAAVQVAQHIGAEIFATAGTPEKRAFIETLGIPSDHIFSSRDFEFENTIMEMTGGHGIDVVLNSLSGDLLEASWNIIARSGTFVEIGKKDMYAHGQLSMEPFKRGASFRAIDLKVEYMDLDIISRLLTNLFDLLDTGSIKPLAPMQSFAYDKVPEALHTLRDGNILGKLVISREVNNGVKVPVRPLEREIKYRDNACYVVVGGLKGLGGSMAVELARGGAKFIAAVARSGYDDKASKTAIHKIRCLGAHIDLLTGDVTQIDDVRRVFTQTSVPVGGIIQGAMVLRDHPFSTMSIQDLHDSLGCKVQGTWNLHNVAIEEGLELDFFTSLSSISSVLGTKGQANYSAANNFLDAFASYRIGLGLRANTINLGVIPDIGYIARNDDLLERYPENTTPHQSEPILARILQCSILQQTADPINPESVAQMITGLAHPQPPESSLQYDARFAHLFSSSTSMTGQGVDSTGKSSGGSGDGQGLQQELRELKLLIRSEGTLQSTMLDKTVAIVSAYLTNMLRLREALEPERPLSAYGMDSLAAVEFRNWVRREMGAVLSMMDVATARSLLTLCQNIIHKVQAAQSA